MRKITALFILAGLSAVPVFSQEMPATLKSELEAKAAELQPSNKSAAKTWLVKQMNAWESIQNLSVAADADDIEMIKKLAEKKFPLDYVSQEVFINEQAVAAAGLPDLKSQIGKASYDAIKAKFDKEGKTDLNEFINLLNAQIAAKSQLEMLKPLPSIDESTFSITKEVLKKKYPDDFLAQLNEPPTPRQKPAGRPLRPEPRRRRGPQTQQRPRRGERASRSSRSRSPNSI